MSTPTVASLAPVPVRDNPGNPISAGAPSVLQGEEPGLACLTEGHRLHYSALAPCGALRSETCGLYHPHSVEALHRLGRWLAAHRAGCETCRRVELQRRLNALRLIGYTYERDGRQVLITKPDGSSTYHAYLNPSGAWTCSCPARGECRHLAGLQVLLLGGWL